MEWFLWGRWDYLDGVCRVKVDLRVEWEWLEFLWGIGEEKSVNEFEGSVIVGSIDLGVSNKF